MEKKHVPNSLMLMLPSVSAVLLKETWQRCHVVRLPWNLKPGCSWSWSKAGDRATWAGMFSAGMRSPTSVSPACTSARCSAGSRAATSWRVRGQRVGGGFENCNWWYYISLQMTALQTFLVLTTTHAHLLLYIHSNICRMLILTVLCHLYLLYWPFWTWEQIRAFFVFVFCCLTSVNSFLFDAELCFEHQQAVTVQSIDVSLRQLFFLLSRDSTCALVGLQCQRACGRVPGTLW